MSDVSGWDKENFQQTDSVLGSLENIIMLTDGEAGRLGLPLMSGSM